MSTLVNGTEDLVGQNLTPAAAYAVVNTALQKIAQMQVYPQDCRFPGSAHANDIRDPHAIPFQRQLVQAEIVVNGDAPSGGSLVVQLLFGGVAQTPTLSLNAGQTYVLINLSSDNLVVAASQACAVEIVTPSGASDVVVKLLFQLVIP
ncbi:MAG: hypothetical protein ABSD58_03160 [Verrucomicrobiia bacterium]|jgi:hypothetical protein